ncbi:hypothetical protein [Streptosporangium sp. NPDC087985]
MNAINRPIVRALGGMPHTSVFTTTSTAHVVAGDLPATEPGAGWQ